MCKEEFFQSIKEDTQFTLDFCKMLHGYSLYDPGFLDAVLDKFRGFGRGNVKHIYDFYMLCYKRHERETLQPIAREMAEKIDRDYERMVEDAECQKKEELLERRKQLLMQRSQI